MDQARNILNSYIPATQWAMNYLNNNITQPAQQGVKDFQTGFNAPPGQGVNSNNAMQSLGDSVANATPTGAEVHAMPLALGLVGKSAPKFGAALRNAGKALQGTEYNVAPKIVQSLSPVLERLLSADPNNAHYAINQQPHDAAAVLPVAEHYMPGITEHFKNDPVQIAKALLTRILEERQAIPN